MKLVKITTKLYPVKIDLFYASKKNFTGKKIYKSSVNLWKNYETIIGDELILENVKLLNIESCIIST